MKSISSALLTSQQALKRKPYTELKFYNKAGGNVQDFSHDPSSSSNRMSHIEVHLMSYDGVAIIVLKNEDLAVPDLRGYYVDVGFGYDTSDHGGSGNESSAIPRLWVYSQQHVSAPGNQLVILTLEDVWRRFARFLIDTENLIEIEFQSPITSWLPFFLAVFRNRTIYGTMKWLIETAYGFTLDALVEDDNIINKSNYEFTINEAPFDYMGSMLMRLVAMTETYLRAKPGQSFEVVYPQESDAVDATCFSDQIPEFPEYTERKSVLLPNHFIVYANWVEPTVDDPRGTTGWENIITAEVSEIGTNEEDVLEVQVSLTTRTQEDANDFANALLQKAKAQTVSGRGIIPMDIRIELYDKVAFMDAR